MVVYHTTINYMSTKIILIKMEVNLIKKALYYFVILSSFRLNSSYDCRFWGKVIKIWSCFFRRFFSKFDLMTPGVKDQNISLMSAVLFAGYITMHIHWNDYESQFLQKKSWKIFVVPQFVPKQKSQLMVRMHLFRITSEIGKII